VEGEYTVVKELLFFGRTWRSSMATPPLSWKHSLDTLLTCEGGLTALVCTTGNEFQAYYHIDKRVSKEDVQQSLDQKQWRLSREPHITAEDMAVFKAYVRDLVSLMDDIIAMCKASPYRAHVDMARMRRDRQRVYRKLVKYTN
jgi:hypothetical protein